MRVRRIIIPVLIVIVGLATISGLLVYRSVGTFTVSIPAALKGDEPGALVAVERTGIYPGFAVRAIINMIVELPEPLEVSHGITLYRVQYRTTQYDGEVVVASGLLAIPAGGAMNSVVSYQHGTLAQRSSAPSQPGLGEGLFMAAAAAGRGHILLAPDYIGLGESRAVHPYMHAATESSTCIDFLRACSAFVKHLRGEWPSSLYLMGFSQGGRATFAVQRDLEALNDPRFQVKASAPVAGPFHLREVSFPQALTGETDAHPMYLSYLSNAYARIYDRPLESLLTDPYVDQIPVLFDGDHESDAISEAMPADPRALFNPDFLDAYDNGGSHWFLDALSENDVYDWTPAAPVRLYYGDEDVDVLPKEALRAETAMKERGAHITSISVGPYDHNTTPLYAFPEALRWFGELAK